MATGLKIPWARILAEGAVIVASILLALAADAWWDGRQSRHTATRQLESVRVELEEARADLDHTYRLHSRLGAVTVALRDSLERPRSGQIISLPDTMIAGLVLLYVPDVPLSSINAFTSSANLDELRNPDLHRELLSWSSVVEDLRDDAIRARAFQDGELMPYLRQSFDVARAQDVAVALAADRLESGPGIAMGFTELRSTSELRNLVSWQMAWFELLNVQSRATISRGDELVRLISVELERE